MSTKINTITQPITVHLSACSQSVWPRHFYHNAANWPAYFKYPVDRILLHRIVSKIRDFYEMLRQNCKAETVCDGTRRDWNININDISKNKVEGGPFP